jgi:hypothetical protein
MLHPDAPLLSDSDVDVEWMAGLEDFTMLMEPTQVSYWEYTSHFVLPLSSPSFSAISSATLHAFLMASLVRAPYRDPVLSRRLLYGGPAFRAWHLRR